MSAYTDNAYEILGVKPAATEKEIKTAYRKLALIHHPDRQTDPAARVKANSKFAAIANAYEILSDQYLRSEYDHCNPTRSTTACETPAGQQKEGVQQQKGGGVQQPQVDEQPEPFRYHFSDPYEVFKRDFRDQFGIDYPGAQNDWVDFDESSVPTNSNGTLATIANGVGETRVGENGGPNSTSLGNDNDNKAVSNANKKKSIFNLFRRNKNKSENAKEQQLVVHTTENSANNSIVPSNNNNRALTNTRSNNSDNSTALVKVEKQNNRPVSMDVQTTKEGKVTTTTITMTRPDGTVEKVTTKTGLPGPGKKKPLPQLTNSAEKLPQLTNGAEKLPQLTNGADKLPQLTNGAEKLPQQQQLTNGAAKVPQQQLTNGASKVPQQQQQLTDGVAKVPQQQQLTNGAAKGHPKLLPLNGPENTARLTNGENGTKPMMLANGPHSSVSSKPNRKLLGWGGSKN
jgi:curved DNA-binding protein CbpA